MAEKVWQAGDVPTEDDLNRWESKEPGNPKIVKTDQPATMEAPLVAQANNLYETWQVRNIVLSLNPIDPANPPPGMDNGFIYFQLKEIT